MAGSKARAAGQGEAAQCMTRNKTEKPESQQESRERAKSPPFQVTLRLTHFLTVCSAINSFANQFTNEAGTTRIQLSS